MPTTLQDIARELNLSHTTVSRVLNARNDRFISEATRERVWQTARRLGYRPNRAAQALVTGRTRQIALWMRYLHTAFHARVVHLVEEQVRHSPYQMIIGTTEAEAEQRDPLTHWHVDGFLVFEAVPQILTMMRGDRSGYPPIVGMGGINYRSDAMDTVGIDLAGGARAAVQHLLDVGCCRIAYVAERMPDAGGEARHDSYTRVVERAGQPTEVILTGTQFRADVRRRLRDYLGEHGCPDGLFCTNDEVALGAYRALCDLGIRVPDDVALVGCDGIEDTEYLERPLTTIVQPVDQMCALAWQFLQRRIDDPSLPWQHALLAPQLVIRDSSRR